MVKDRKQPQRDMKKRPCFNCGKEGHLAKDCREKPQPRAAHIAERAESGTGQRLVIACVETEGGPLRRRGQPVQSQDSDTTPSPPAPHPAPRVRTLGDMMVHSKVSQGERKRVAAAQRVQAKGVDARVKFASCNRYAPLGVVGTDEVGNGVL